MARTGRLDIHEGQGLFVLMHSDRRDVSSNDATKDAVGVVGHGGNSL